MPVLGLLVRPVEEVLLELLVLHNRFETVPPLDHLFLACHLVPLRLGCELRILLHHAVYPVEFIPSVFVEQYIVSFKFVEVALFTLRDQVRVDNLALNAAAQNLWVELLLFGSTQGNLFLIQHLQIQSGE